MTDVRINAPPAVIRVPSDPGKFGAQTRELTDADRADMLQRALTDATLEVRELRQTTRLLASILEMLVLMNRRGERPRTVDEDGTLLIPRLPLELMQEIGGSVTVAAGEDGFRVKFRDRMFNPVVTTTSE
jgi:hypothetical protein